MKGNETMKYIARGFAVIIGFVALGLALPALGQNSITLTGVNGSYSAGNLCSTASGCEQVYTGLYYATVDNNANTGVICDDFNHNITIGETWSATAINTSSLNAGNIGQTEFGSTIGFVGYAEVASLVSEIFTLNNGSGVFAGLTVTGTDLAEAIWDVTTKGGISGISANAAALVTYVEGLFVGPNASANAQAYLNKMNFWILTPSPNNGPQELWALGTTSHVVPLATPEGGSALLYLMLAGFTCFGAMFFRSRNQLRNRQTA
jgi:hypothetical protein